MNLQTNYLGFLLDNPIIPGAGPFCDDMGIVRRLEDAGAPMLIMHSVFQEQIIREEIALNYGLELADNSYPESITYLPRPDEFRLGPDEYLAQLARIKDAVAIPVVASLNGRTIGGWVEYARQLEQAGADALELNIYDPILDAHTEGSVAEENALNTIRAVRRVVSIPIAVKLSPFYTSFVNFARKVESTRANAIILFNRYYQPDIDIEKLDVFSNLHLSTSAELLPRLRYAAALHGRVALDIAVTGGVHNAEDVVKSIMAGATAVQMVSALLLKGPDHLKHVRNDLARWLEVHEYDSLQQALGTMSLLKSPNPSAFERGNYMKILQTWSE